MFTIALAVRDHSLTALIASARPADVTVVDHGADLLIAELPDDDGAPGRLAIEAARRQNPLQRVLVVAARNIARAARAAIRLRADDFLGAPITAAELRGAMVAGIMPRGHRAIAETAKGNPLLGTSEPIRRIRDYAARVALTDSSVLITGETGTGKDLVAELIHKSGPRQARPFVHVNTAAVPESLFESELFGFEKGAFTGANVNYPGKLRMANGGTILLDEVGDISPAGQAKLLRAIEAREVVPLGAWRPVAIDVRIIAATNRDIDRMSASDDFRSDLLFRLNVIRINMPPLRDRLEDVPILIDHFVDVFRRRFRRDIAGFRDDALRQLEGYRWPGNIRELRNVVEVAFVHALDGEITAADLPDRFHAPGVAYMPEKQRLLDALQASSWNVSRAASALSCSRMTLYRRMTQFHISRDGRT